MALPQFPYQQSSLTNPQQRWLSALSSLSNPSQQLGTPTPFYGGAYSPYNLSSIPSLSAPSFNQTGYNPYFSIDRYFSQSMPSYNPSYLMMSSMMPSLNREEQVPTPLGPQGEQQPKKEEWQPSWYNTLGSWISSAAPLAGLAGGFFTGNPIVGGGISELLSGLGNIGYGWGRPTEGKGK